MWNLLLGIATDLATILMALLPVDAQARLLLEHLFAAVDATHIWIMFGVCIDVLHQILALRKGAITNLAFESLHHFVNVHKMTLEAV